MTRFLFGLIALISMSSSAASIDSKTLILSCQEYVAIYDRKGEASLIAGISTSVAEAMRAGVCRGMLEEHAKHDSRNCSRQWYQQALIIARQDPASLSGYTSEQLLDSACEL